MQRVLQLCTIVALSATLSAQAHPLRLSLTQVDYDNQRDVLIVNLRLFLMDVNEALVFDPDSQELAFCQPNESPNAERLLLDYLAQFFEIKVNGNPIDLKISNKKLGGEGINTALDVQFEHRQTSAITSLHIRNAVFTDLFFDQTNVVYVHINEKTDSLMLNKKTQTHTLRF